MPHPLAREYVRVAARYAQGYAGLADGLEQIERFGPSEFGGQGSEYLDQVDEADPQVHGLLTAELEVAR